MRDNDVIRLTEAYKGVCEGSYIGDPVEEVPTTLIEFTPNATMCDIWNTIKQIAPSDIKGDTFDEFKVVMDWADRDGIKTLAVALNVETMKARMKLQALQQVKTEEDFAELNQYCRLGSHQEDQFPDRRQELPTSTGLSS